MDLIIVFFRDVLSGWLYYLVAVLSVFFIFAIIGFLGDRKKAEVQRLLRELTEKDLLEGKSAARAALEGKQVICVTSEETNETYCEVVPSTEENKSE